jgi:hypothetical protein
MCRINHEHVTVAGVSLHLAPAAWQRKATRAGRILRYTLDLTLLAAAKLRAACFPFRKRSVGQHCGADLQPS